MTVDSLDQVAADIRAANPLVRVCTVQADLAVECCPNRARDLWQRVTQAAGGPIDVLVLNAGTTSRRLAHTLPLDETARIWAVNVQSAVTLAQVSDF